MQNDHWYQGKDTCTYIEGIVVAHPANKLIFDPCSNGGPHACLRTSRTVHFLLLCLTKAGVVCGAPKYEIKEEEGLGDPVGRRANRTG